VSLTGHGGESMMGAMIGHARLPGACNELPLLQG
jgi:hypothetical protein